MPESSIISRIHEGRHAVATMIKAGQAALELSKSTTPIIDQKFMTIAHREADRDDAFFTVLDETLLLGDSRPDAIQHNRTLLPPNPLNTAEINETIGLVDLMLPGQIPEIQAEFAEVVDKLGVFENLAPTQETPGKKFIIVSNHLQLPDQGFTMGFFHKVAAERGIDRLEHYSTAVIGRVIGYFQLGDANVVDGILRKAGSVLKTFPSGGSEALSDEEQALKIYRAICNHYTKQAFAELISSRDGRLLYMAPSGEQDKFHDDRGVTTMRPFGKATCQMIVDASNEGAIIIPAFVDYGSDASIVKFLEPRTASSIDDCHQIGRDIAATGTLLRGEAESLHLNVSRFKVPIIYE